VSEFPALSVTSRWIEQTLASLTLDQKIGQLSLRLEQNVRVLCYHFRGDPACNVDAFDDLLRERGVAVTRFDEMDRGKVRLLTGEIKATGKSPVNLNRPYRFKPLEGLWY
jgi:hypothetical protein